LHSAFFLIRLAPFPYPALGKFAVVQFSLEWLLSCTRLHLTKAPIFVIIWVWLANETSHALGAAYFVINQGM